jgi:hypothetical protein
MSQEISNLKLRTALEMQHRLICDLPRKLFDALVKQGQKGTPLFITVEKYDYVGQYAVISDETARRVELLLSSHAKTIFTAWASKQLDE